MHDGSWMVVSGINHVAILASGATRLCAFYEGLSGAALLEDRSAPLVCAEGQPNSAVHALLELLVSGGSLTRYHGDFDWDGLRIGGALMARYGSEPWRFSLADYMEAVPLGRLSLPEPRSAISTPWSPGLPEASLPEAMAAEGVAIHEEQVLASLIEDLSKDCQPLDR